MNRNDIYLENNEDQISAQKREAAAGRGVLVSAAAVGILAGVALLRKKVALSKTFSSEIKELGRFGSEFSRYVIGEGLSSPSTVRGLRNFIAAARMPLPSGTEQLGIALSRLRSAGMRYPASGAEIDLYNIAKSYSRFDTFLRGPIAAIAPRAPLLSTSGRMFSSGKHGAVIAGDRMFRFGPGGGLHSIVSGVKSDVLGSTGSRLEFHRTRRIHKLGYNEFVTKALLPRTESIYLERKREFIERYMASHGINSPVANDVITSRETVRKLSNTLDDVANSAGILKSREFFRENSGAIRRAYEDSVQSMLVTESSKDYARTAYRMYRSQMNIGLGEPFATERGFFQRQWRSMRESLGLTINDPITGRAYAPSFRKYTGSATSLGGYWSEGVRGKFYARPAGTGVKQGVLSFLEGTFFEQMEGVFGVGISSNPNRMTNFISHALGASRGSYGELAIRRYVGGFGRLAVAGVGAAMTFKAINYIARQTTGWGVTDVAGKMYTSAREFQQNVLAFLGVSDAARKTERAFPGSIKSPLMTIARAASPIWMTKVGGAFGGKSGAMTGLALGIATALISWGDITQSPEELHRIYTGQQDIPVRRGRFWIFGKTPFGGGKISYWRPHWYPLMRSRYKYRGQLWDSETEELAQGSALSPILAPILQGRMWDPYYWEKKHYYDRPYPLTGELFEPTMPFAWLGNLTIGNIIKPQRTMHPEYSGVPQGEGPSSRTAIGGSAGSVGMPGVANEPFLPSDSPSSVGWRAGEGLYTLTEQMGLRGFFVSSIAENITGRSDFLPEGPVVQSARRATGYERAYWDLNIGDPGGTTEFFRRLLPHRRRGIEEYNPIRNMMPDWLPGEDYFINFQTGDPYTKVEMGEARLPGSGYESLHRLHSGIPKVYDAVDRFMILADIAPYSREYTQYRYLAEAMTRKEPAWSEAVKRKIQQREDLRKEYEFLELTPPEEVTGIARTFSTAYRHALASITGAGGLAEPFLSAAILSRMGGRSAGPFAMAFSPISKFLPYKTAQQTYKDYRLHGSEFTEWSEPMRDFLVPYANKAIDFVTSRFGVTYVPPGERRRRGYEEYFDKLQYVKFRKLAEFAEDEGNAKMAKSFSAMAGKTMIGVNPYMSQQRIMGALPKRERTFFDAFISAPPEERDNIKSMMSPQMARIYEAQWGMKENRPQHSMDIAQQDAEAVKFFSRSYLPDESWGGWNPEVDIKDVQLKVVKNEGMNIHNFDLWESQERAMRRRPYVPTIRDIRASHENLENLKRAMMSQMVNDNRSVRRINSVSVKSRNNIAQIRTKVYRDRSDEYKKRIKEMMYA